MKGLKTRAISAVVFVAVMIGGIYGGWELFNGLLAVIGLLCLSEYYNLVFDKNEPRFLIRKILGFFFGGFVLITAIFPKSIFFKNEILNSQSHVVLVVLFLYLLFELFSKSKKPFENAGNLVFGVLYAVFPIALFIYTLNFQFGYSPNILMGTLLLIWSNDTFAYLVGSKIGKNKLFPRISPGKTWEGTIGGGICALGISFAIAYLFKDLTQMQWLIVAAICVVFGTLGDLVESMLKRSKGVKDSGNIMPGHGGALDRFDAFLFVLPFVSLYLIMI